MPAAMAKSNKALNLMFLVCCRLIDKQPLDIQFLCSYILRLLYSEIMLQLNRCVRIYTHLVFIRAPILRRITISISNRCSLSVVHCLQLLGWGSGKKVSYKHCVCACRPRVVHKRVSWSIRCVGPFTPLWNCSRYCTKSCWLKRHDLDFDTGIYTYIVVVVDLVASALK